MTEAPAIDERLLTPYLKRLIGALGLEQTIVLLKARGGTRVQLPKVPVAGDVIVNVLGQDDARKLVQEFGAPYQVNGEVRQLDALSLPKLDKIVDQLRDAAICASTEDSNTLALRYNLTRRQVQNIRANKGGWPRWRKVESGQRDLFGETGTDADSHPL